MSSTYSTNLKVELIGTGDQAGSWGTTTNGNLGTVLEEAIVGKATVNFASDADKTISMGNGPATSDARCIYLNLTSTTLTATRTLTVPAIQKTYIIYNGTTGGQSITVSSGIGTTVTVLNGKRAIVYVDGANVVLQSTDIGAGTTINGATITTIDGSQTLTNKTLTAPTINGGTVTDAIITNVVLPTFGGASYKNDSLTNKINTGSSSTTIQVEITSNGAAAGDYIRITGATAVGGVPAAELNGVHVLTSADTNNVYFTVSTTSSSTPAAGGGTITYYLYPQITPPSTRATLFGATETVTLTNKRITPRVNTVASGSTITPDGDASDMYTVTALAVPATIAAPSGTPVNGQKLILRIKDDGTARALTWNSIYQTIGTLLPTTTVAGKLTYVGLVYNSAATKWDVVAVTTQV